MMLAGVIIAGGNASRMDNAEKPLALLRGRPLVDYVVERTRPQVNALALNVKEEVGALYRETAARGLPLLVDRFGGEVGPLGGVLAGLEWATACGHDWLATFPADTPFLPHDLVAKLATRAHAGVPAVATTENRVQGVCALWPVGCLAALEDGIETGRYRSLWWTLGELGAERCHFEESGAFFNVNTKDELAEAEMIVREAEGCG